MKSPLIARMIVLGITLTFVNCGCLDPRFTRMPTWYASHPIAENRAIQRTDPFPDPNIGPETFARPRDYARPRTEPRRAAEERLLNGFSIPREAIPPSYMPGGSQYPNSVQ